MYQKLALTLIISLSISCASRPNYTPDDSMGNQCKNECNQTCVSIGILNRKQDEVDNCFNSCYSDCYKYNGGQYTSSGSCLTPSKTSQKSNPSAYQSQTPSNNSYASSSSGSSGSRTQTIVDNSPQIDNSDNSVTTSPEINKKGDRKNSLDKAKNYMKEKMSASPEVCAIESKEELYNTGKRKSKKHYCTGDEKILMGISYTYYGDGIALRTIESYFNGQKDGYWFSFELSGKLKDEAFYQNGQLSEENTSAKTPPATVVAQPVEEPPVTTAPEMPKNNNCFFDEKIKKEICCKLSRVLDKKTKKLAEKFVCDDGNVLEKDFFN